jgi:cytochrome P450
MTRDIDLSDVDLFVAEDHVAALGWLRAHRPVYWNRSVEGPHFWALTRYEDVVWAYRNHAALSSSNGAMLGGSYRSERDSASGKMLVATDLPRHRLLKAHIQSALSASVVECIGTRVRQLVDAALARLLAAGGGDFATDVADELPAGALMTVFGIDHDDAHRLIDLTHRMVGYRDEKFLHTGDAAGLRLAWIHAEILDFLADIVARRRRRPEDDLASILVKARINGRALSEEEVAFNCLNVAVGGNETSAYTASAGLRALIEAPDQYERLLRDPSLLPTAVEEMLRWGSVNAYVQRIAVRDVTVRDVTILAGQAVTLWNVSANMDERHFPDPHVFDVGRTPNRHLAYGAGIHRCIGAPAANTELTTLFSALLETGVRLQLTSPPRKLRSNFILGTTSLKVEVL